TTLVLFRPPGTEGHYYTAASGDFAFQVLEYLATQPGLTVVFSPRYAWQSGWLERMHWINRPILLSEGVEFVSLLKAVDAVIASGGTMVREAAYLGIPAFSVFKGRKCSVDRYLESLGRLTFIEEPAHFPRLNVSKKASMCVLREGRRALAGL